MTKQELADRWHAPKHVIEKMIKAGKINYTLVKNGMNALLLIDISDEEVARLEEELEIPADVLNSEEVCELLGIDFNCVFRMTQRGMPFTKLSYRIKLYSRQEVLDWFQSH